jgi:hypothetical protein
VPSLPQTADALRQVRQLIKTLPNPSVPSVQALPKIEAGGVVRRRRGRAA